jgi:polysaccharide export outer membrane protein
LTVRLRIPPQSCFFASLLFILAGCSDLVPGINIDEGGKGTHQYRIVRAPEKNGYEVKEAAPVPAYEVVEVTPDLLVDLAKEKQGDALDSAPSLLPSNVPVEYRLGPGDVFFVVVWDHPELTAPYTGLTQDLTTQGRLVAADGSAFYPYVGTFKAAGMTAKDLRTYLADRLKSVINNPQVDVRVVAYRANRIEVTGEVLKPGTLNFNDTPLGVLQAIDAAGGLTPLASRRRAVLVRDGTIHVIDLAGLLSGARPVANPELKPGDVLHLPDQSGDQVFVLGAVTKPAPVVIQQDSMTLIQAITQVGGLDVVKGKDSGILVFRPRLDDADQVESKVFTVDLSRPEGVLLASQFQLEARDVVYIKATKFSQYNAVITQLLPTITGAYQAVLIKCFSHSGSAC